MDWYVAIRKQSHHERESGVVKAETPGQALDQFVKEKNINPDDYVKFMVTKEIYRQKTGGN